MAEERQGSREVPFRRVASWTQILRTFLVALDPFKLLIAAFGILATAVGWWLISWVIWNFWAEPNPDDYKSPPDANAEKVAEDQAALRIAQERFVFMAGLTGDEGESKYLKTSRDKVTGLPLVDKRGMPVVAPVPKDGKEPELVPLPLARGRYRVMPWLEDRGPNPWNLTKTVLSGTPDDRGQVLQWFYSNQAPNLVEPLRKFLSPIINLFDSRGNGWTRLYLLLVLGWFLLVWAFVGGVITRMAILQLAGKEGGSLRESIQFVSARYWSYFWSPVVPIIMIGIIVLCCILFGIVRFIPVVGDIVLDGLLFFLPLAAGFVMALLIVGLVGYPLMYATLSAEGSDTFDSLSRSYNYVYESPWTYLWYAFLAILYGAVLIFFVVFMCSFMVYLTKWGLGQTPGAEWVNRTTDHLFMYSPTSFGWRELLLAGTPIQVDQYGHFVNPAEAQPYLETLGLHSKIGAGMVGFWLTLIFLMMLGFGYSYFWTVSSMIYLLMRKKVDETEMDEVYLEEEEIEEPIPSGSPMSPPPASTTGGTQMVDAPALRVAPPATTPPATSTPAATPTPAPASIPVPAPAPEDTGTLAKPNPPKEQPRGDSDPAK